MKVRTIKILKLLFLLIITLLAIIPFIWVLISSFKTNGEILESALSLPKHINFQGYIDAFKTSPLLSYYWNSIIIAVSGTVLNTFIVGMAAYVLARFDFKLNKPILLIFSLSLLIPFTALILPTFMIVKNIGLYDKRIGLILVYMALGLPTTLYILRSYFLSIPKEIEEASYIDGGNFFKTYIKIIIPIAKPGFATAAVLQFLLCWNEFLYALVLTNSSKVRTVPLAINYFLSQFSFDYRALFAAIVIINIPSILSFVILQEQVVDSLAAGSVKG
ncbi:sugar ABC transporter permease [Vallitalea longa]|uniref:Sugar ABC transporter permease n=1 Tax=Vallitalea longa TaxID=2936439 RepID=A0A9W5Y7A0_9FIRM|nr:carbohydrate ABC transporter permease [Vallitalea longa]GKX27955.1 sugar ABC transporter permease [Vallitalea longa]